MESAVLLITAAICANAALVSLILLRILGVEVEDAMQTVSGRLGTAGLVVGVFAVTHIVWLTPSTGVERLQGLFSAASDLRKPFVLCAAFLATWIACEAARLLWPKSAEGET
jgi:hypothetical protein